MLKQNNSFKFAQTALAISCIWSGVALAENTTIPVKENNDLLSQQLEVEKKVEDASLEKEQAQQSAEKFQQIVGEHSLLFKPQLIKIYESNNFSPLWNAETEKMFLRDYSLLALSGVSAQIEQDITRLAQAKENGLQYDILLSDAFLNYLYYSQNVANFAQKWLYAKNAYRAEAPAESQIEAWLSANKAQQMPNFLDSLTSKNSAYQQTVKKIVELAKTSNNMALIHKLAINAQRLRTLPSFENGLFVNIPSYQLNYYRDGQIILSSKVIVGKMTRKTPVLRSKLSNVVVNPPWNAPIKLINEDIIPKVRKDPSYIYRNSYTIIDSKGNTIDPYTIDWENMTAKKFPYRLRQVPGDDSALGRFKFNMPSSDAIYLHDTPNRKLFGNQDRALSSGCVRVEKADQLATILLKEAGWNEERKQKALASRKTMSESIRSNNPVYLYYVTAWVENGKLQNLPDIYKYDGKLNPTELNWVAIKANLE